MGNLDDSNNLYRKMPKKRNMNQREGTGIDIEIFLNVSFSYRNRNPGHIEG